MNSSTLSCMVVGFSSRLLAGGPTVRDLVLALQAADGAYLHITTLPLDPAAVEPDWHARLQERVLPGDRALPGSEGVCCRFVRPGLGVDLHCAQLRARSRPDRLRLRFDAQACTACGLQAGLQVLAPRLVGGLRERMPAATGLDQLPDTLQAIPSTDLPPEATAGARILQRGVWTKTLKGQRCVRKCILLETGRSDSPFALHCTDYSPARRKPLATSLSLAGSRAAADAQVGAWQAANIKGGWEPA